MKQRHDWLNLGLGSWVLVFPWVLKLSHGHDVATWGTALLGATLITLAAPVVLAPKAWEQVTTIGLGFILLVSPWVLDFSGQTAPTASAVIVGALVVALGASTLERNSVRFRGQRLRRRSY